MGNFPRASHLYLDTICEITARNSLNYSCFNSFRKWMSDQ